MDRKIEPQNLKPLLGKTTKPFIFYVLLILAISIPIHYWVMDGIWKSQLDEYNQIIAQKTAYELNKLQLSEQALIESISLWNSIQPTTNILPLFGHKLPKDSVYSIAKENLPYAEEKLERFRGLSTIIYLNETPYRFKIETNIEETHQTIAALSILSLLFSLFMISGLLLLNRYLSNKIWKPFHRNLNKLKKFDLNNQESIQFQNSDIKEFEELNQSLEKLLNYSIASYNSQKEFTENASHELQTPIAILQHKLDMLLQSDGLTKEQYLLAEDMNRTLTRSSRINKNLLLLTKIENKQFSNTEIVNLNSILLASAQNLEDYFKDKNINLQLEIIYENRIRANKVLVETMFNNLLINAFKYTESGGFVNIKLDQALIEFQNSGTDALNKNKLFKRFTKDSHSQGTGLGLAIVDEICKFHEWKLKYGFEEQTHIFYISL